MNNSSKQKSLAQILNNGSIEEKLLVLQSIDPSSAIELFDQISALSSHYLPEMRVAALKALRFVDPQYLVQILRDSLRDENKDVRYAAAELFHLHDLAA